MSTPTLTATTPTQRRAITRRLATYCLPDRRHAPDRWNDTSSVDPGVYRDPENWRTAPSGIEHRLDGIGATVTVCGVPSDRMQPAGPLAGRICQRCLWSMETAHVYRLDRTPGARRAAVRLLAAHGAAE